LNSGCQDEDGRILSARDVKFDPLKWIVFSPKVIGNNRGALKGNSLTRVIGARLARTIEEKDFL